MTRGGLQVGRPLTAAVFATAVFAWRAVVAIARDQADRGHTALLVYAALEGIVLLYGLHASAHSDGTLLAYGLGNAACAFFAFMLMPAEASSTTETPQGT
jgi:hypothetical protein